MPLAIVPSHRVRRHLTPSGRSGGALQGEDVLGRIILRMLLLLLRLLQLLQEGSLFGLLLALIIIMAKEEGMKGCVGREGMGMLLVLQQMRGGGESATKP